MMASIVNPSEISFYKDLSIKENLISSYDQRIRDTLHSQQTNT